MNSLLDKCNKLGLKMTEQRRIITQVLSESKDHPDVELVYKRASKIDKNSIKVAPEAFPEKVCNNMSKKCRFWRAPDLKN